MYTHPPAPPLALAGVIIPLLAELDPANASQLFMNWDMASCLKWRYANKISLRRVYLSELSVAANHVPVPDAAIVASTVAAATEVGAVVHCSTRAFFIRAFVALCGRCLGKACSWHVVAASLLPLQPWWVVQCTS